MPYKTLTVTTATKPAKTPKPSTPKNVKGIKQPKPKPVKPKEKTLKEKLDLFTPMPRFTTTISADMLKDFNLVIMFEHSVPLPEMDDSKNIIVDTALNTANEMQPDVFIDWDDTSLTFYSKTQKELLLFVEAYTEAIVELGL